MAVFTMLRMLLNWPLSKIIAESGSVIASGNGRVPEAGGPPGEEEKFIWRRLQDLVGSFRVDITSRV